jgi:methylmalonyl-CoA/ethylmalonyl-CoA epimerase
MAPNSLGTASGPLGDATLHHLGVAVKSVEKAIPVYRDLFGYELFSGPFEDPLQRVSVCFLQRPGEGEIVVELVAPLEGETPISRILVKREGPYHTCYEVRNLDQALAELSAKKCIVISEPVPAVAFNQRRIAWLVTPTQQLVELLER